MFPPSLFGKCCSKALFFLVRERIGECVRVCVLVLIGRDERLPRFNLVRRPGATFGGLFIASDLGLMLL